MRTAWTLATKTRRQIRRPLFWGAPGCEEFPWSCIFDFSYFHILDPLRGQSLISHVSCLMSQVLLDCLLVLSPKKRRIALNPLGTQDLGWPQNHHENSSIFEPVSKATEAMKIGPKATQNCEKSTLESQEIQFLRKLIFAILSMPNACFSNPRRPNLDPKTNRKSNLEKDMQKTVSFVQKCEKNSQNGSPKLPKNQ